MYLDLTEISMKLNVKKGNRMKLVEIYNEYKSLNNTLQAFLEKFIEPEATMPVEQLKEIFEETKGGIENLLEASANLTVASEHEDDLRDLNYLMTDTLFLLMDLVNFCNYNEIGRCKMRAINYLGKRKRVEVFGQ